MATMQFKDVPHGKMQFFMPRHPQIQENHRRSIVFLKTGPTTAQCVSLTGSYPEGVSWKDVWQLYYEKKYEVSPEEEIEY